MLRRSTAHNPKLIKASNAIYVAYQAFSKDLKKFGFVKRVDKTKKPFSCHNGQTKKLTQKYF